MMGVVRWPPVVVVCPGVLAVGGRSRFGDE